MNDYEEMLARMDRLEAEHGGELPCFVNSANASVGDRAARLLMEDGPLDDADREWLEGRADGVDLAGALIPVERPDKKRRW